MHNGEHYREIRGDSERICAPLCTEDYVIQSMPDVSPPKWHLAHTSWFFETFLLTPYLPGYEPFDPRFASLFNSYYQALGEPYTRARRGMMSRPTVEEVYSYRRYVDEKMAHLFEYLESCSDRSIYSAVQELLTLGLHHEQQHQELLWMDIKHILWTNPLRPAYRKRPAKLFVPWVPQKPSAPVWRNYRGGLVTIGAGDEVAFAFDNERPSHKVHLEPFQLASRPVTHGEYLEFIEAGGYRNPSYWLSEGWRLAQEENWQAPLYWEFSSEWKVMTWDGMQPIQSEELWQAPVCHVSYFEAEAYAHWKGMRLPTEEQWELAARESQVQDGAIAPVQPGAVWEWTASSYLAYPGFRPFAGKLGEYNGKFMCNQMVLRGGSSATPSSHYRVTYRNFFAPSARWAFSGFRLAN